MTVEIYSENFTVGAVSFSIELTADQEGLSACRLLPMPTRPLHEVANHHLREAADQLKGYFDGTRQEFTVPLAPDGTHFQAEVWKATASVPYGQVRSYRWIAEQIGRPKATRAVAQALGANPLLLFVPCHRIVSSNGELGGFSCGIDWKVLFLAVEGIPGGVQLKIPTKTAPRPVRAKGSPL